MAVRTADFAFGDFRRNLFPSIVTNHFGNIKLFLSTYMVKFKTNKVSFAAIYAGMAGKIK